MKNTTLTTALLINLNTLAGLLVKATNEKNLTLCAVWAERIAELAPEAEKAFHEELEAELDRKAVLAEIEAALADEEARKGYEESLAYAV